ncbi:MAG TPA: bifunctional DNA-formamidopyrimidine glycosylase/DNA-(apurinic or apyrimidinic site) lyase [Micavibrio sp.]
MPELPEVESICRDLRPVLKGQAIKSALVRRRDLRVPFPKGLAAKLAGRKITRVARRAKYILVHLDSAQTLVLHLGMSGRILIQEEDYKPQKHDHFMIILEGGRKIVFNDPRRFGVVHLIDEDEMKTHSAFLHLGPEPLSNQFSGPVLAAALKGKKTAVKTAIMDQRIVVGVGNIYASESLFMAGIDPARLAGAIRNDEAESLAGAIRAVLDKAIRAGGSTLRDYRRIGGEAGSFQNHFAVYDKEGRPCPGCICDIGKTGGVRRIVQGGRSTFYCPGKQG